MKYAWIRTVALLWVLAATLAHAAPAPAEVSLQRDRQRALVGQLGWDAYLSRLSRLRPSVFRRATLSTASKQQLFRVLWQDRPRQLAILRDRKALERVEQRGEIGAEHLLGIPIGAHQPRWISSMGPDETALLGRITRETLQAPRQVHGQRRQTVAYYHLPGNISQPILHAHGVWRPRHRPRVRRWGKLLRREYQPAESTGSGYGVYLARPGVRGLAAEWPIVAVARCKAGKASQLRLETDRLLGQMLQDVARATLRHGTPEALAQGRIEIDRADSRIVVRLVRRRQPWDVTYW